jgi:hypothetical protein
VLPAVSQRAQSYIGAEHRPLGSRVLWVVAEVDEEEQQVAEVGDAGREERREMRKSARIDTAESTTAETGKSFGTSLSQNGHRTDMV